MSLNREAVYQALFDLVTSDPGVKAIFTTTGRFLKHIDTVNAIQMPALYMFQLPEQRVQKGKGIPAIRTLRCQFVAYFNTLQGVGALPATALNTAADAIDIAITEPGNPGNVQTLGGLVEHVYIEPTLSYYEGLLQDKSALVATVAMLVP